ncbi:MULTISPECIES: adenylosuccinate lyase [unclassified Roseobacter]|uniref:adenylosuccinate lyase n=1 Tax=unclassified Roseobacter TaxID=196798 RepID=UPI0018A27BCA|nr:MULTISPECIES: adenylosuccinate lyase [unclassified Roseobacter]MDW3182141.1 adenylosuccinate lyase [Roseobacter sp.]
MTIKTLAAAVALTLAPALAFAAGCNYGKEEITMSCAAGTVYDTDSKSCVATTT